MPEELPDPPPRTDVDETATADTSTDSAPDATTPKRRHFVHISAGVIIAVLTALLGFAIVVQVHQNSRNDNLANLRDDDLIGILDDQNARADRLREQIAQLEQTVRQLQGSGNRSAAARHQAEQDAKALGVLLGTLPADGPGVRVTVTDPQHHLTNEDLLDVVEELRGAGAEAIQFGSVRVSTTTAFTEDADHQVRVDGTAVVAPYEVLAIGDPKTLDTALNIPGGVADAVRNKGGQLHVDEQKRLTIAATRPLPTPTYAVPSGH
ncbi:MAG TPA: DUF881 domain-containing protein [Jatrophihabitantaceae bacterium]